MNRPFRENSSLVPDMVVVSVEAVIGILLDVVSVSCIEAVAVGVGECII